MARESPVWRHAAASAIGTSHARREIPCQDASACRVFGGPEGGPVLVAIAADGAGSALRAEVGAELTCTYVLRQVELLLSAGDTLRDITRGRIEFWLAGLGYEVSRLASAAALRSRDFASTLVAAVVGCDCAVLFQVGDGGMVIAAREEPDAFTWVFWPSQGEHENLTFFATEPHAAKHLEHALIEGTVDEVALFTDGLQRAALHFGSRTARSPFFHAVLAPLRAASAAAPELSADLAAFLASPAVNQQTDDDKTLILATRRQPEPMD